jgi:hypothetical protein
MSAHWYLQSIITKEDKLSHSLKEEKDDYFSKRERSPFYTGTHPFEQHPSKKLHVVYVTKDKEVNDYYNNRHNNMSFYDEPDPDYENKKQLWEKLNAIKRPPRSSTVDRFSVSCRINSVPSQIWDQLQRLFALSGERCKAIFETITNEQIHISSCETLPNMIECLKIYQTHSRITIGLKRIYDVTKYMVGLEEFTRVLREYEAGTPIPEPPAPIKSQLTFFNVERKHWQQWFETFHITVHNTNKIENVIAGKDHPSLLPNFPGNYERHVLNIIKLKGYEYTMEEYATAVFTVAQDPNVEPHMLKFAQTLFAFIDVKPPELVPSPTQLMLCNVPISQWNAWNAEFNIPVKTMTHIARLLTRDQHERDRETISQHIGWLIYITNYQISFRDYVTAAFAVADKNAGEHPTVSLYARKLLGYMNSNPNRDTSSTISLENAANDPNFFVYPSDLSIIDKGKICLGMSERRMIIPEKQIELWSKAYPLTRNCYTNIINDFLYPGEQQTLSASSLSDIFRNASYRSFPKLYLSHLANTIMAQKNVGHISSTLEGNMMKLSKAMQLYNDSFIEYARTRVHPTDMSISSISSRIMDSMTSSNSQTTSILEDDDFINRDVSFISPSPITTEKRISLTGAYGEVVIGADINPPQPSTSNSTIPSSAPAPVPVQITVEAAKFRGCGICEERSLEIMLWPCKHTYCKECIGFDKEESEKRKICPYCQIEIKDMIEMLSIN